MEPMKSLLFVPSVVLRCFAWFCVYCVVLQGNEYYCVVLDFCFAW